MKTLLRVLFVVIAADSVCLGQDWWQLNDTIVVNSGGSSQMSAGALQATVQTVNITGNISALVVPVGFSDKPETQAFPVLVNSDAFPVLGVNQSGILLKDLITANGGSLPEDQWWGPAFNHYFTTESGGLYNVNFQFIKKSDGTRYQTIHPFSHFGNVLSGLQGIINEVGQNMYADNPHTSLFYVGNGSTFNYTPYMTSTGNCPIGGGAAPVVQDQTPGTLSPVSGSSPSDSLLRVSGEALDLLDYGSATSACRSVLGNRNASLLQKQIALARLSQIFLNEESHALSPASSDPTILSDLYYRMKSKDSLSGTAEELLATDYAGSKQLGKAQDLLNDLISKHPGTDLEKRSLVLLASLRWFDPSYYEVSSAAFSDLISRYGSSVDAGLLVALGGSAPQIVAASQEMIAPTNRSKTDSTAVKPLLFQIGNYPNPFNPTTVISYQIPEATHVSLAVYDMLGRVVATLVDGEEAAGYHEVTFDGSRFASGVYFYRLATPTYSVVRKMILMK